MDRLFLHSLLTFSELGVYSVTMSIAAATTVFSGIFSMIWGSLVYKWVKTNNVNLNKTDEISEHLLASIYFIIVLSSLFSWILLFSLPKEYTAIHYLITLCLLAPLFYTLSETTAVGISIARKNSYLMYASIIAMISNAIGNYLLVPQIRTLGAAISAAVSFWPFYIFRTELLAKVWRNILRKDTYKSITVVLLVVILSSTLVPNNYEFISIWLFMGFFGCFRFKKSIILTYEQAQRFYVKQRYLLQNIHYLYSGIFFSFIFYKI